MAQQTLLEIITQVCNEIGLVAPSAVVSATDLQTKQMYALANREITELRQMFDWTNLQSTYVITVAAPISTTGTVTEGSAVITGIPTTAGLAAQTWAISGDYLNQAARVDTVDSGTQVTMNMPATGSGTIDLVFSKDTYPEPTDFDRYITETWWDRTNHWALIGPNSPQIDEWHRSGIVAWGPRRNWRQVGRAAGGIYRLWPPIGATEGQFSIAFEYISSYAVVEADGTTYKATFTEDDDQPTLDSNAVVLGLKWRWMQIKQLDYAPMQVEYLDYVNRMGAKDGGMKTLSLAPTPDQFLIGPQNVADGNWPGN